MFSDGRRSSLPASPAPHWRQVPTDNSQMPVSRRKNSFCSPCWHQPVDLTSSTRVQISATYIDVTRSVSERVVWQGLMSNVGFLTESSTFIIQGRKDTAGQQLSFAHPAGRVPEHICMPHSLIWLIKLLFRRSSTYFGPAPLLNVGDTSLPLISLGGETDISLRLLGGRDFRLFCLYNNTGPGTWCGLSQYLLNKCLDE